MMLCRLWLNVPKHSVPWLYLCVICALYYSHRTGTVCCPPYQHSTYVWKQMSLIPQSNHLLSSRKRTERPQLTQQRVLLLSPIYISRFLLLLWLPALRVSRWEISVYIQPWEPVSCFLEVSFAMERYGCDIMWKFLSPYILIVIFYSPGNENVNLTLEFLSDNGSYTCLTISAPSDLLPTSV